MKATYSLGLALALAVMVVGCGRRPTAPAEQAPATSPQATMTETWTATLEPGNEVPPVSSQASGTATLTRAENATEIDYTVSVKNINDITEAHLHEGKPGENGEVVVWLYPEGPPPSTIKGPINGVLAQGSIDAARLVGPLKGRTIQDLVDEMNAGNIYVNVHTEAHPDGEIRGQLQAQSASEQGAPMAAPGQANPMASPAAPPPEDSPAGSSATM